MKTFDNITEAQDYFKEKSFEDFEKLMTPHGLAIFQLGQSSSDELIEKSLVLNVYIEEYEKSSTPFFRYRLNKDFKIKEGDAHNLKFQVLPLLQNRKGLLKTLINVDKYISQSQTLLQSVNKIQEEDIRNELKGDLKKQFKEEFTEQDWRLEHEKETLKVRLAKEKQQVKAVEIKNLDEKSKIWYRFVSKESLASILGAVLLIIIGISIVVAMFCKVHVSELVQSTFLVILGYFFGHSVKDKVKE